MLNFAGVQKLLDDFVAAAGVAVGSAPHGAFWNTNNQTGQPMTYEAFTTGPLPLPEGYEAPFGNPLILVIGDADASPIIDMLQGSGSYWDEYGSQAEQMPRPSPPYNNQTPSQSDVITQLTDWINAGCPNDS